MPLMPPLVPQWATDETNNAEPLDAKKETGIVTGGPVISSELNWLLHTLYQWTLYGQARAPRDLHIHQNWLAPNLAAWTDQDTGTGVTSVEISATSGRPGPWLKQLVVANNDQAVRSLLSVISGPLPAGMRVTIEWLVDATDLAGTPSLTYKGGLIHDTQADPSTEDVLAFYKSSASANWRVVSRGASLENGDTGVAAAGVQRLRLEYYGSGWDGGERLEAWIDDVLCATNNTNFPTDDDLAFSTYAKSTGALNKSVYVAPMTLNAQLQAS